MKYDQELCELEIYEISELKDIGLTGNESDVFSNFLEALQKETSDSELKTDFIPPPDGALGALVPHTKLVIRLPKFAWGIFQTLAAGLWMAYQRHDPLNMTVGGGFAFVDGIARIKDAFYQLKAHKGEYCTYQATLQAADYGFLYRLQTTEKPLIWHEHLKLQPVCTETQCQFHNEQCTLQPQNFEVIIDSLVSREVLFEKHDEIGIKL